MFLYPVFVENAGRIRGKTGGRRARCLRGGRLRSEGKKSCHNEPPNGVRRQAPDKGKKGKKNVRSSNDRTLTIWTCKADRPRATSAGELSRGRQEKYRGSSPGRVKNRRERQSSGLASLARRPTASPTQITSQCSRRYCSRAGVM